MRSVTSAASSALSGGNPGIVLLLSIASTPAVNLASTTAAFEYGGTTYQAGGNLGTIEPVQDSIEGTQGLKFMLSALPPDVVALAMQDTIRGDAVTLKVGIVDSNRTLQDVATIWTGFMDQMPISIGADPESGSPVAAISATAVHRGTTFGRPKPLRNTDVDQQKLLPGDTSRRFVITQSQHQDVWPSAQFFRV